MDEIGITFFTNEKVRRYLDQCVLSGLYGKTVSEAVERIVAHTIEDMLESGQLTEIESPGPEGAPGAS